MEGIYVPIDFSDLKEILPPNEEIIYSTLCTIRFSYWIYKGRAFKRRAKYNSHVLITEKGIAYYCRIVKSNKLSRDRLPRYNTLLNMFKVKGENFKVFQATTCDFRLIQHPTYESEATFNERIKEFRMKLTPYLIDTAKTLISYILENRYEEIKKDSPLWRIDNDFFAFQSSKDLYIPPYIEPLSSELSKKYVNLAYVGYKRKKGNSQPILILKTLDLGYIFNDYYIKVLNKMISTGTKYMEKWAP